MAGTKGMNWKWKLGIALLIVLLMIFAFIFTPFGMVKMQGWLKKAYNECPPEQRLTHWSADAWMFLAWWEGTLCQRDLEARRMYQEFLGIVPMGGKSFSSQYNGAGLLKWNGFFNPKADKKYPGWGIFHERAPEAYYEYLRLYQPMESAQFTTFEAAFYHTLFYEIYPNISHTNRPHPKFYKYWDIISQRMMELRYDRPKPVRAKPPDMEGPLED